ncbi:MAG TPA: hypothetical protein VIQ30_00205 [Pseudonocardia sp.]
MGANTGAPEPVDLFTFLRTVEVAAARKKLTRQQERVARLIAYDSAGTTGGGVVVNDEKVAIELGISSRRVWVHFKALVEAGWFVRTTAPTRGIGSSPGRRAKYQCTTPVLDLGLMSAADLPEIPDQLPFPEPAEPVDKPPSRLTVPRSASAHETPESRLTVPRPNSATDRPTPAESSDGFGDNRLTVLEESSDGAKRENSTHSPSGVTPADGYPSTPVPQQPKPQDAREPVDNRPVDVNFASAFARVRASIGAMPRHARPTPPPIHRPDRE